jgi:flagellar hook-associated protein 1 FlgK
VIVEQDRATELYAVSSTLGGRDIRKTVIRSKDGTDYVPTEGKLGAFIKFRDEMIEDIISKFDTFTESLVNAVNFEHQSGYGLDGGAGRNFFEPNNTKSFNISVSNDVEDVSHIAVSKNGDRGDGANALKINELSSLKLVNNQFSLGEYYNATISDIGIWAKDAKSSRTNEELLINQIDNAREGVKGVNIDEELITMIQAQHIYQGASRMIVVLDSLLETLIGIK